MSNIHKQIYFDKSIHLKPIKDCISGQNEKEVLKILESLDFKVEKDFVRQHPIANSIVVDFAFINEQIAIEIDGRSHRNKKQQKIDNKRDNFLRIHNWIPIRIYDKNFFKNPLFFKYLIQEIVHERRKQYEDGQLFPIDIPEFNQYE